MPKSLSPVGFVGAISSDGECSASDDDGIGQKMKSSIVVASSNKVISTQRANSAEPPSPTASRSDSSASPKTKRRRSASHSSEEGETPEWKRDRSFTPDDEIRERKWKPAEEDGKSRRSHRDREEARERRDQRRMEDRRRRFNDDRDRVSDRRDEESDNRRRSYYDRSDRHREYRHADRRYRDERDEGRSDRYYDRDRSDRDRFRDRRDDRRRDDDRDRSRRDREDEEEKENKEKEKKKAAKTDKEATLATRTGGAYIPPARLRAMQAAITDKSGAEYQRMSWEALKKSINGLVNKVNVSNIGDIIREILAENVIRGRGLLCQSIIRAQAASPTFTHVYAALVAIVNSKFPQIGELLLQRVILQFRRSFRRNDKALCISSTQFIAHLVNQQVAHEIVALEILTLLLEKATNDSVEVAVGFLKECGMKLTEVSPTGINAIFERMRTVLHESEVEMRVQYMIEVMFQVRKDKFKDHKSIEDGLELVDENDQFTHLLALDEVKNGQDILNVFNIDPNFQDNEEKYKEIKKDLLGSDDESGSSDGGSGSSDDSSSSDEEAEEAKQKIIDQTETNLVGLRRTIYLTLQSSLDYEEATHKLLKVQIKPGQENELCNMILDCGAQQRTYEKFYGLIAQRLCMLDRKYVEHFEKMFMDQYQTCHRLDPTKLRNVSKFFAHLLHTDAVSWGVLQVVKMNEDDTTSSSRIFVKQLFLELSEYLGLPKLNDRLKDETLQGYFEGLMPKDHPKKTRFAINFFTSIGLGGVTDGLREHLKNMPKPTTGRPPSSSSSDSSSSSSSSSSSDSSSDSD